MAKRQYASSGILQRKAKAKRLSTKTYQPRGSWRRKKYIVSYSRSVSIIDNNINGNGEEENILNG